jgi:hypothetical protein
MNQTERMKHGQPEQVTTQGGTLNGRTYDTY